MGMVVPAMAMVVAVAGMVVPVVIVPLGRVVMARVLMARMFVARMSMASVVMRPMALGLVRVRLLAAMGMVMVAMGFAGCGGLCHLVFSPKLDDGGRGHFP